MKRRIFLRNSTVSMFAIPVLGSVFHSLAVEAEAQDPNRTRFILYNHANSLQLQKVNESSWSPTEGFNLNGALAPLAPHASELLVVERMYNNTSAYLHGNASSAYSCASRGTVSGSADGQATKVVGGITIDQLIAQQISRPGEDGVQIQSLVLSNPIPVRSPNCSYGTVVGTGDNVPSFPITDPVIAFERLFGTRREDPALMARLLARRSQLDHLRQEIASVNATLPAEQRQSLDLYLTSIRAVEQDIARLIEGGGSACETPAEPERFPNIGRNDPQLWRAFIDLGIAALRCGLTRQLTLLHTYGCIHWTYEFDGERKNHHEVVCHTEETGPFMTKILRWHAEQVAYLYSELKASGQAEDTVILWMSDGGGQHHGGNRMYPAVLLGAPGKILDTGKWVHYEAQRTSLARFHLTLANAFGSPVTSFGDGTDPGTGVLSELLP